MDDALSRLLDGVVARGEVLDPASRTPPWAMRFDDGADLSLVATVSGSAWLRLDDGEAALRLGPHDVAIVTGGVPHVLADDADRDPDTAGVVRVGYRAAGAGVTRVLESLPAVVHVEATDGADALLTMVVDELREEVPGRRAVLDRLLDLLLVRSLRSWFTRSESATPGWYAAHADPTVGPVLALIHDSYEQPWTVGSLADAVGVSRATLASRFTELVGQPPIAYLTEWRICQACDLLVDTDAPVESIAHEVGYADAYALSTAFHRLSGLRPGEHRAKHRSSEVSPRRRSVVAAGSRRPA